MNFTTSSFPQRTPFSANIKVKLYLIIFAVCWIATFMVTTDRANWFIENVLTILFFAGLIWSYKRFVFSDLSYTLMFVFMLMHIYGATYTYAENPLGFWLQDVLELARNPYDRIVHFSFGLLLTYPMRDYFTNWFKWPVWVCWILPIEITMSFSGMYEIIEWLVAAIFFPAEGAAYLGSQGDVWDAQKDMSLALSGAILSMLIAYFVKSLQPGKA